LKWSYLKPTTYVQRVAAFKHYGAEVHWQILYDPNDFEMVGRESIWIRKAIGGYELGKRLYEK
jgi:hypothetical protein